MKFLFVHQNFPGQFLHIVRHLVQSGEHEIAFITEPNDNIISGVHKIPYRKPEPPAPATHIAARELEAGVRRAEVVAQAAANLKRLGFEADMIIGHHGWGEMLNLPDIWPDAPMLGYLEFYYDPEQADVGFDPEFPINRDDFPRIRAKNAINHIALNLKGEGQTPTAWQLSTYPAWAQSRINLLWEGVDLDTCQPNPAVRKTSLKIGDLTIRPRDKLVTYVSRDLEPYRGYHPFMRSLPHLLKARPDVKIVLVGGDGVSYGNLPVEGGTWRQVMLKEVGSQIDQDRIVFPGRIDYATYVSLLQRSDAHVYLTYPFVASWSLRESLAIGCPIIGSDTQTVREFITHGQNGILTSFFDPLALAQQVLRVLEDRTLSDRLREGARAYATERLSMTDYIAAYEALITRMLGRPITGTPKRAPAKAPARKTASRARSRS